MSDRKVKFELSSHDIEYAVNSIGASNFGSYIQLLGLIWKAPKQYLLLTTMNELQKELSLDQEKVKSLLDTCIQYELICHTKDFFTSENSISSPMLEKQIESYLKNKKDNEFNLHDFKPAKKSSKISDQLSSKYKDVSYIKKSECDLNRFTDWLPTKSFDQNGQALIINSMYIKKLGGQYPHINVSEELNLIFEWLMKNSSRRPPLIRMNDFIDAWLARSNDKAFISEENDIEFGDGEYDFLQLFQG